jgi:cyanophycinase-like exopeptidase
MQGSLALVGSGEFLRESPTWEAIERNFRSGSSLAGCSAGAMALSSHIPNFRLKKSELPKQELQNGETIQLDRV